MLLTENFIEILAEANQMSSMISGHLFTYSFKKEMFEVKDKQRARIGFKCRSMFLLFNITAQLLRILSLELQTTSGTGKFDTQTDIHMSIMSMFIFSIPTERYRVRGSHPENFSRFFNEVIKFEKFFIIGNKLYDIKILFSEITLFLFIFAAKSTSYVPYASTKSKLTKKFFHMTRFIATWIGIKAVAVICAIEKSVPLNPLWIFENLSGIAECEVIAWQIFRTLDTFGYNYCLWTMIAVAGGKTAEHLGNAKKTFLVKKIFPIRKTLEILLEKQNFESFLLQK